MSLRRSTLIVAVTLLAVPVVGRAQEKQRFANRLDALRASGALAGQSGPRGLTWIEGGKRYSYTDRSADGKEEIRAYDPATDRDTLVFSAAGLTFPNSDEAFTYRSFQWAHDFRHLVFQTNFKPLYRRSGTADFYVYSLADHSLRLAASGARTGELSPDGTMLGYERDGDMYVSDLSTGTERRLTDDATEHVYNGHFDWVYEEEFGMAQAWNWSPDSRHLAYWHLDESPEPSIQLTDYSGTHPEWTRIRIPQPGDSNAIVRVGVADVKTGRRVWLDPQLTGEYYIPRIYWTSRPDTLAVVTLNRRQNEMKVFFFDVTTGGQRIVLTQNSDTWIDVYDFYAGVQDLLTFPEGSDQFFWVSDRDGWQHIYRYDYSGRLVDQVTKGRWSVTRIEGIDPGSRTIFFTSTEASPVQRQLYAIRFDGSRKRRLTDAAGTHAIDMSPEARYYVDTWSSLTQPRHVELRAGTGRLVKMLAANDQVSTWLDSNAYSTPEIFSFTTSDSVRIDASMIKPTPFDSTKRYPVIFTICGGPGSQAVYDRFHTSGGEQWLAQEGYIIVDVNNRGTNNYGSAFMKVTYRELGKWESHDFAETAKYLATLPYVDSDRIAIMGGSYGGYSTIYSMEMYPEIFKVGIANSPGTDWRLYDTIYTERYMDLLGDNLEGYKASSAVEHADQVKGHLLVIHSMMDDNVHPVNTMQFLTAATNAGVDVDLRIYPPGRHGAMYNTASFLLVQQLQDEYLAQYLKGICPDSASQ